MKIVIDIDDNLYARLFDNGIDNYDDAVDMAKAIRKGTPLPKCNRCKYYEGVHNVQGHAPCEYHKIGGVLWNWYCSQFKADKEVENETISEN